MIKQFYIVSPTAAYLQIPYLIWCICLILKFLYILIKLRCVFEKAKIKTLSSSTVNSVSFK